MFWVSKIFRKFLPFLIHVFDVIFPQAAILCFKSYLPVFILSSETTVDGASHGTDAVFPGTFAVVAGVCSGRAVFGFGFGVDDFDLMFEVDGEMGGRGGVNVTGGWSHTPERDGGDGEWTRHLGCLSE